MGRIFLLFIICFFSLNFNARSQNLTNEGTDFWIGFTEVYDMTNAIFEINITSAVATTGTVKIIGGSGFTTSFKVVPGLVTIIRIPSGDAHNPLTEKIVNRAIHVESVHPISVFASTYERVSQSEASVCLPTQSLGSDYMITTYPYEKINTGISAASEFVVVCGPKPIQIEITPTCPTLGGNPAGKPIFLEMIPGDMYQVQTHGEFPCDLSGSTVKAINGTDLFAVYNGHKMTSLTAGNYDCKPTSCPLYETAYPTDSWGYQHIVVLTKSQKVNLYRVVALRDSCDIFENGMYVRTINSGEVYEDTLRSESLFIRTTKKASVSQFMVSYECSGKGTGDPSLVVLNPIEQMYLDTITFFVGYYNGIFNHFISVITRTSDIETIILDDKPLTGFKPVAHDSSYSYAIIKTLVGSHTISTTGTGFLAYSYGNILTESYFYAAGVCVNLIDDTTRYPPAPITFPFSNDSHSEFVEKMEVDYNQSTYEIAQTLIKNPSLSIDVNGYTSTPGDSLYNLQLSADRATTVRDYIVQHIKSIYEKNSQVYTFNESRIAVRAFGEDLNFLIEQNDNDLINDDEITRESKQAKNRRVEVEFRYE